MRRGTYCPPVRSTEEPRSLPRVADRGWPSEWRRVNRRADANGNEAAGCRVGRATAARAPAAPRSERPVNCFDATHATLKSKPATRFAEAPERFLV